MKFTCDIKILIRSCFKNSDIAQRHMGKCKKKIKNQQAVNTFLSVCPFCQLYAKQKNNIEINLRVIKKERQAGFILPDEEKFIINAQHRRGVRFYKFLLTCPLLVKDISNVTVQQHCQRTHLFPDVLKLEALTEMQLQCRSSQIQRQSSKSCAAVLSLPQAAAEFQ